MARELRGDANCMAFLSNLSREEILEVLSQGLCNQCNDVLKSRALRFLAEIDDRRPNTNDYGNIWQSKKTLDWRSETRLLNDELLDEMQERVRFEEVGRRKDFLHIEKIDGELVNVLRGLELHTEVFNSMEQKQIVDYIFMLQHKGQNGQLRARTYSEPKKWMRGKGRITIQFGCCYNYAVDKNGNPPGIVRDEEVDPLPPLFKQMIKRMIRWKVIPEDCIPDSCIVNIYEKGDCIPPHIDHHDFVRPFFTVSFVSKSCIIFGKTLKVIGPGEFDGPVYIPLPIGSVLVLNGNGADVAKHCIPGVESQRISITFRKMDEKKLPYMHFPDRELMGIKPLMFEIPPERIFGYNRKSKEKEEEEEEIKVNAAAADYYSHHHFPYMDAAVNNEISRKKRKFYSQGGVHSSPHLQLPFCCSPMGKLQMADQNSGFFISL